MKRFTALPTAWLTLITVCMGLAMLMVDTFVIVVALPAIARELQATLASVEWTVSAYVLAAGILPVAMGRVGDIVGRRKMYLWGLWTFILASVACAAAPSILMLVMFRFVQGVGAAIMLPGSLSLITHAFPPRQRGVAIGIWGGVGGLGLIAGPLLGGLLVTQESWRWIFLVNVPIGVGAVMLALRFVPESRDQEVPAVVDWPGLVSLVGAFSLLLVGITNANAPGVATLAVWLCLGGGIGALGIFGLIERRVRFPLVDLTLLRNTPFVMACCSGFWSSAAVMGAQPYTSLFLQNYWGFSPLQGGLAFLPATILVAAVMPLSGWIGQRFGSQLRVVVIAGSLALVFSGVALLGLDATSTYMTGLLPALLLRGVGAGIVMTSTSLAAINAVPMEKSGLASGILSMSRNMGTVVGVSILGTVFLRRVRFALSQQLQTLPHTRVDKLVAAAEHFIPSGEAGVRATTETVILSGFLHLAVAVAILGSLAALAACFIRSRVPTEQSVTAHSQLTSPRTVPGRSRAKNPVEPV